MKRSRQKPPKSDWSWQPAPVDATIEHFELRYGDAGRTCYEDWLPVARVGRPVKRVWPVEWLAAPETLPAEVRDYVVEELNFYLVEHSVMSLSGGPPDKWEYAIYHCRTMSNMYSKVHWSYFPEGEKGLRFASSVLRSDNDGEEQKMVFCPEP